MSRWKQYFESATWTGGTWGEGEFNPGDMSPEEIILALAYTYLAEDALLLKIFGRDRIEMMDVRNPTEFRDLPRLQCYLGSLQEDRVATKLDDTELFVYFGIRMDAEDTFRKVKPGEVGLPAVMRKIKRVLKDYQSLPTTIEGASNQLGMARNSNQEGGLEFIFDVDPTAERYTVTMELQWRYRIKVNADTGNIYNAEVP